MTAHLTSPSEAKPPPPKTFDLIRQKLQAIVDAPTNSVAASPSPSPPAGTRSASPIPAQHELTPPPPTPPPPAPRRRDPQLPRSEESLSYLTSEDEEQERAPSPRTKLKQLGLAWSETDGAVAPFGMTNERKERDTHDKRVLSISPVKLPQAHRGGPFGSHSQEKVAAPFPEFDAGEDGEEGDDHWGYLQEDDLEAAAFQRRQATLAQSPDAAPQSYFFDPSTLLSSFLSADRAVKATRNLARPAHLVEEENHDEDPNLPARIDISAPIPRPKAASSPIEFLSSPESLPSPPRPTSRVAGKRGNAKGKAKKEVDSDDEDLRTDALVEMLPPRRGAARKGKASLRDQPKGARKKRKGREEESEEEESDGSERELLSEAEEESRALRKFVKKSSQPLASASSSSKSKSQAKPKSKSTRKPPARSSKRGKKSKNGDDDEEAMWDVSDTKAREKRRKEYAGLEGFGLELETTV